ncbi:MAG: hypothetical protein V3V62_04025 [bacterium]
MRTPEPPPRAALFFLGAVLFLAATLGGCTLLSRSPALTRSLDVTYDPPLDSKAFRDLHIEKQVTVVTLKIAGDDVRSNMARVTENLLSKGYAVRDYNETIRILAKENLIRRKPMEPEVLDKSAKLFPDQAGIAGNIQVLQMEPLKVILELHWIDMKARKSVLTIKAALSEWSIAGAGRDYIAVQNMIDKALEGIPRAR